MSFFILLCERGVEGVQPSMQSQIPIRDSSRRAVPDRLLRACPLPTVSGNGITLRGNLWVTPGILRRGKAAGNTSCLRLARQTFLSSLSFFLFSFTILSLATKLITFHSLLARVCSICARP